MAKFNPVITTEKEGNVNVSWLPREFSQSRLGGKIPGGSNACTLIAILVAQKCYQNSIKVDASEERVNQDLVNALGESILQGNQIHKQLSQLGVLLHVHLTVPEAIVAAGSRTKFLSEWKSRIYLLDLRGSLHHELNGYVHEWYRNPPPLCGSDLFVILIAENRSVILVFYSETNSEMGRTGYDKEGSDQRMVSYRPVVNLQVPTQKYLGGYLINTGATKKLRVALIDSHSHARYGAVIACCALSRLGDLCTWYSDTLSRCCGAEPSCYELTFLYFRKLDSGEGAHNS